MDSLTKYAPMFLLLKKSLLNHADDLTIYPRESNWEEVYTELCFQRIEALPYKELGRICISDKDLYDKWQNKSLQQIKRWTQVMIGQKALLELLEKHSIKCVIIKGAAAAISYPIPQLRKMGDVDFLVSRADYEKAAAILENNGYELKGEKNDKRYHYAYSKGGIVFELHKRLAIIKETDDELIKMFEQGIAERNYEQLGNYSFPVLPTQLNGIVLILHIDQHLRSGIGLRQIIDWMMYINKNGVDGILPLLKQINLDKFALTVTAMCQKYLGLKPIIQNIDEYPCDELMRYILSKGNFGVKSGMEGKITSAMLVSDNPIHLFKRLQTGGLKYWGAVKKNRILRPFAWLYPIFYAISGLVHKRITINQLRLQKKEAIEQRELLQKMGLKVDRMLDQGQE